MTRIPDRPVRRGPGGGRLGHMSDWPDDQGGGRGYGRGSGNSQPEGARAMRHVQRGRPSRPAGPPPGGVPQQTSYDDGYDEPRGNGQPYGDARDEVFEPR
ncbi:hypothetical protein G3I23_20520, partial [Streptomyces sp. SID10115]|nr:hypothetical protein [Streptomyces sp. SID10115]